ncbi:alpha/beta hydrolase [Agromyces larvae]|uniref:Dienelactone hydrolase family protein n=1 Tax=Agromyces larvae TaxID=2929802 RepID=A0ABY4BWW0_9MICO|nr:dienelactone hydrolase family protein [Agromyces larvae]UOE42677.1 dienelactone hydrolase family protein [Agromyces larvae]
MRIDDEAVLWSAGETDRAGRPLLLLLHGYNSHEGDLFGLAPYLPLQPVIASLRAPIDAGYGFAWFPLFDEGADAAAETADASVTAIVDWLDRVAPDATGIGLLGFSQGGAMALELLRRDADRFAFAAALAGFALPGEREGDARLATEHPPVFWGRGTADEVIPAELVRHTQRWLPQHADLDARIYEGLAHSVDERELGDLVAWLRARYA